MFTEFLTMLLKISTGNIVMFVAAFIIFIYSIKKMIKVVINGFLVAIGAGLFPIALIQIFGWAAPLTLQTVIDFVVIGIGMYAIYLLGRGVHTVVGWSDKILRGLTFPARSWARHKKEEKTIEKVIEKREKKLLKKKVREDDKDDEEKSEDESKDDYVEYK